MLYYFLISIDRGRERLDRGPRWSRKWESSPGVHCAAESYSFNSNSNGTAGRLRGLNPPACSAGGTQPLHSAAAELVCIGANCFFNYWHWGNAARCLLFGEDAHRELLSVVFHKLQTTGKEWGGSATHHYRMTLHYSRWRTETLHYGGITDSDFLCILLCVWSCIWHYNKAGTLNRYCIQVT